MMYRKPVANAFYLLLCLFLLASGLQGYGQSTLPLGGWRVHVPYHQAKALALAGNKVYVAADKGLFYFDKEFNTTQPVSKVDGLSEQQVSTIAYDEATKTLVIAYKNTNLDLIQNSRIINVNDILRKAISGDKTINSISIHNKQVYIASTFGVVVLDLAKHEVRDSYRNLGPNGEAVSVRGTAILRDSIYLTTDLGVLAAKHSGTNLQDYRNWSRLNAGLPANGNAADKLASFNNKLYLSNGGGGIYTLRNGSWVAETLPVNGAVVSFKKTDAQLSIASGSGITVVGKDGSVKVYSHQLLKEPRQAEVGPDGTVWVADMQSGLVKLSKAGTEAAAYTPNGPYSENSFKIYTYGGKVYVLSGGFSSAYLQNGTWNGFYTYDQGGWESFNRFLYPNPAFVKGYDLVDAVYNPITKKLYLASYGNGVIEWEGPAKGILYNGHNSTLLSALSAADKTDYVRVTSLAVDAGGNVWAVNRNQATGAPGLHMLSPEGTWKSYVLPGIADGSNLHHILIDDNGQKWLSVARRSNRRSGLVVFDEAKNRVKELSIGNGNGGLPNGDVYALAKDLNGDIWVGTANGVGIYYNPASVFAMQSYDARVPIVDRRPMLDGQTVRTIAVDGANRKWMGTDNGLWLFNPEGDKLIRHFNASNSPLPSNKVLSVAVEHSTGEVFVATDAGVASYRAEATVTEGKADCATVFPNPVRKDYTGLIGVSGLPDNANVRITDVAGMLVYKTKATGGTLAWDARDYNGKRVKAGVYLVMSSSDDGSQTCISKIAVLD